MTRWNRVYTAQLDLSQYKNGDVVNENGLLWPIWYLSNRKSFLATPFWLGQTSAVLHDTDLRVSLLSLMSSFSSFHRCQICIVVKSFCKSDSLLLPYSRYYSLLPSIPISTSPSASSSQSTPCVTTILSITLLLLLLPFLSPTFDFLPVEANCIGQITWNKSLSKFPDITLCPDIWRNTVSKLRISKFLLRNGDREMECI